LGWSKWVIFRFNCLSPSTLTFSLNDGWQQQQHWCVAKLCSVRDSTEMMIQCRTCSQSKARCGSWIHVATVITARSPLWTITATVTTVTATTATIHVTAVTTVTTLNFLFCYPLLDAAGWVVRCVCVCVCVWGGGGRAENRWVTFGGGVCVCVCGVRACVEGGSIFRWCWGATTKKKGNRHTHTRTPNCELELATPNMHFSFWSKTHSCLQLHACVLMVLQTPGCWLNFACTPTRCEWDFLKNPSSQD
jgi:hypothetical protein